MDEMRAMLEKLKDRVPHKMVRLKSVFREEFKIFGVDFA